MKTADSAYASVLEKQLAREQAKVERLRVALGVVLDAEPTLEPTPALRAMSPAWYSEGWNRCARDVRAVIGGLDE